MVPSSSKIKARRIIGLIFFYEHVNSEVYEWISMEFVVQLGDVDMMQHYFQQDGTTCHTSGPSILLVTSFFENRRWTCGPDLNSPDFYVWGLLKNIVYANRPTTLHVIHTT